MEKEKSFLRKCWKNKRLHALMVLVIWIIVLAFLMGVVFIMDALSPKNEKNTVDTKVTETKNSEEKINNTENNTENVTSYYDKLHDLASKDYQFTYFITNEKEQVKFEGIKKDGVIIGYKQANDGIIKYKIENQKTYQILLDKEVEINNLYENLDSSLLDLNYILGIINQVAEKDIIVTEEEAKTTYDYDLSQNEEGLEVTVIENTEEIEKINIHRNTENYELAFEGE